MGEVYRATDTKLGRAVALKILPDAFATDPDRVARFQREAKTLALLNHPNIGGIYGLEDASGVTALVLELVDGPTLADRIAQGSLPVDEALPIAQQIAGALEAAHEQGIVHRDLKPANIKLRPDGTVKVLDFGLAKAAVADSSVSSSNDYSPTITTPAATRLGVIMGTAAYMSPEQARGKPIDKRTDIWAFGCVLYEMLTARRPFVGEDVTDVMAAILAREPDLTALPATTPPVIRRLLQRCLQKDRSERLRDIGDARIEIRDALAKGDRHDVVAQVSPTERRSRSRAVLAVTGAVAAIVAATAAWLFRPPPAPAAEVRLEITTPLSTVPTSIAISPAGRTVAFVATSDAQSRLWVRALDSATARPLNGTDGAMHPFWSPDSRSIGFFADNKLKRVEIDGGAVRVLANVYRGTGGGWSRDGGILVSSLGDPISRLPANGGEAVELKGLVQQGSNFLPAFLPDGQHFLYFVRGTPEVRGVYVGQLEGTSKSSRLLDSDGSAVYGAGHLFFIRQRTVFAQRFDPARLELNGDPVAVAQNPAAGPTGVTVSVSDTGSIAYRTAAYAPPRRRFVWFDRSGKAIGDVGGSSGVMSTPSLSPDDQRAIGYRGNPVDGNIDIWMLDMKRGTFSRVTSNVSDDVGPAWGPDGDHIIFSSNRKGSHDLYRKSAVAGGNEELLLANGEEKFGSDWSSDGRFVLYESRDGKRRSDLWALPLDGHGKPIPVAQSDFEELRGQFSPDGKWVAYQSDESGRHEI
jgi:Tol biopolymer transport system component